MELAKNILQQCETQGLKLALAESCTGGALSASFTSIPGASKCFQGSIIAYQNQIKTHLLKVPYNLLQEKGAVDPEVALYMVKGALLQFSANTAIAVTGLAGPEGGKSTIPVGTIYFAMSKNTTEPKVIRLNLAGDRQSIIHTAVELIIQDYYQFLTE